MLTQTEWDAATEEDFLLTLPVNVRWSSMDDGLLERTCWSQYPELAAAYPKELRSRILVCHRGITSTNMEGAFYGQKVGSIDARGRRRADAQTPTLSLALRASFVRSIVRSSC